MAKVLWTLMVIAIARLGQQLKLPYVDVNLAPLGGVASMLQCNPFYACAGQLGMHSPLLTAYFFCLHVAPLCIMHL